MRPAIPTLSLSLLLAVAQDASSQGDAAPRASKELEAVRLAVREACVADVRYDTATGGAQRTAFGKQRRSTTDALADAIEAWEKATKRTLLHDSEALAFAFQYACGPVPEARAAKPRELGAVVLRGDGRAARAEYLPSGYVETKPHATVCLVAGSKLYGDKDAVSKYLADTWKEAAERESTLVVAPILSADMELDAVDSKSSMDFAAVSKRVGAVLGPLGQAWRTLHTSRGRMVLDCGRGASAFGLRLLGRFPDRFASLVLRWPIADENLRIEALAGVPVLLVRCPETAEACKDLHQRLNAQSPGTCQILTPPSKYPYAGEVGIGEWVRHHRRDTMPTKVCVAPMDQRFVRSSWIQIRKMDSVGAAPWSEAPLVVAEADRKRNRITVETRGVKEFRLSVGPALVDVRDFTLVLNGEPQNLKLTPSLTFLRQWVRNRSDPRELVTAACTVVVP